MTVLLSFAMAVIVADAWPVAADSLQAGIAAGHYPAQHVAGTGECWRVPVTALLAGCVEVRVQASLTR